MKNLINKLKTTNQFSTGDLTMIQQMQSEGNLKSIYLWIKSKATPLLASPYSNKLLLGHRLNDMANSLHIQN